MADINKPKEIYIVTAPTLISNKKIGGEIKGVKI